VLSLVVVGLVIKVFGRVVLLFIFGESLAAAFNKHQISPIAAVLLGLLVVGFIGFIPILGFFFSFLMGSSAGHRPADEIRDGHNWFRRGPRPSSRRRRLRRSRLIIFQGALTRAGVMGSW